MQLAIRLAGRKALLRQIFAALVCAVALLMLYRNAVALRRI